MHACSHLLMQAQTEQVLLDDAFAKLPFKQAASRDVAVTIGCQECPRGRVPVEAAQQGYDEEPDRCTCVDKQATKSCHASDLTPSLPAWR